MNSRETNTIGLTLVYKREEYLIQTREKQYFTLMALIADHLNVSGFGLCCGTGSCGTYLIEIDGSYTLACALPANEELANTRIKIDVSRI